MTRLFQADVLTCRTINTTRPTSTNPTRRLVMVPQGGLVTEGILLDTLVNTPQPGSMDALLQMRHIPSSSNCNAPQMERRTWKGVGTGLTHQNASPLGP